MRAQNQSRSVTSVSPICARNSTSKSGGAGALEPAVDVSDHALPGWLALVVKTGTPPAILQRLSEVTAKCIDTDSYRTRLEGINAAPVKSLPSDVKVWTDRYTAVYKPLIEKLDLAE